MDKTYSVEALVDSREAVTRARIRVRDLKQRLDLLKPKVQQEAIESAGGNYGKNAEERDRFLQQALNESASYSDLSEEYREATTELEIAETQFMIYRDLRRDLEYQQRESMIRLEMSKEDIED